MVLTLLSNYKICIIVPSSLVQVTLIFKLVQYGNAVFSPSF